MEIMTPLCQYNHITILAETLEKIYILYSVTTEIIRLLGNNVCESIIYA